jgi:hypothetical protein
MATNRICDFVDLCENFCVFRPILKLHVKSIRQIRRIRSQSAYFSRRKLHGRRHRKGNENNDWRDCSVIFSDHEIPLGACIELIRNDPVRWLQWCSKKPCELGNSSGVSNIAVCLSPRNFRMIPLSNLTIYCHLTESFGFISKCLRGILHRLPSSVIGCDRSRKVPEFNSQKNYWSCHNWERMISRII